MKLKVVAAIIVIIAAVGVGGFFYTQNNNQSSGGSSKKEETTTEAGSTEDNEKDTSEEAKKDDSKKDSGDEATTETDKNQAKISTEEGFDSDDSTETQNRESDETKELFKLTLKFINEYDLDSDHFKVTKALMVQNDSVDYMYFVCKHNGKTEYACYNYDGGYYRDDISQSKLKKEYDDYLVTKEYDDQSGEVYYEYSKAEIKEVNNMY